MTKKNILIATGGTGGHIFPALSLAKILFKDYSVMLPTAKRDINYINDHKNFDLIKLPSSPLIKKNIFTFLISSSIIIYSIIKSFFLLLSNRPALIFGMGGYSSFPVCIAAFLLRIKFVIYENNLILGKANKYLLPLANKLFVSYNELNNVPEKYKVKILEIGNIIREEIINLKKEIINNEDLTLNILVLGGSQAARVFAVELPQIFEKLKKSNIPIKIFQQCQKEQTRKLSEFYLKAKIDHELFNFTNKITDYYSKSNLVITRSGASALGELININIPFISIPLPTSADNHQLKNAEFYEKKGYGYLIKENDIKLKLFDLIKLINDEKSLIKKIISNQRQYSDKNIFRNLGIQIEKILNEKN